MFDFKRKTNAPIYKFHINIMDCVCHFKWNIKHTHTLSARTPFSIFIIFTGGGNRANGCSRPPNRFNELWSNGRYTRKQRGKLEKQNRTISMRVIHGTLDVAATVYHSNWCSHPSHLHLGQLKWPLKRFNEWAKVSWCWNFCGSNALCALNESTFDACCHGCVFLHVYCVWRFGWTVKSSLDGNRSTCTKQASSNTALCAWNMCEI